MRPAGTNLVEVTNEGLRSSLTRGSFRHLLALGQQLAPPPPPAADADSRSTSAASDQGGPPAVRVLDYVEEDAFRRWVPARSIS